VPIVDSSVALKWLVDEPDKDIALELLATASLVAPDFLVLEVRAALWSRLRRGLNDVETIRAAEKEFSRIAIPLLATTELARPAFELAHELSHPIYDCVYLAAAVRLNEILITADNRFIVVGKKSKYAKRLLHLTDFPS
jgi:predicted nucleic acid-binding protein